MKQLIRGLSFKIALVFTIGLTLSQNSEAQFIKCSGDLNFWYEEQVSGRKFARKLHTGKPSRLFKPASVLKNRFAVGSVWAKPEVLITPFLKISADIQADKRGLYQFSTDGRSWFILSRGRQKLECDIAETEYF